MKMNPVYRQETTAGSRSFKLPLVILIFNSILALVALLDMYSMINQVRDVYKRQIYSTVVACMVMVFLVTNLSMIGQYAACLLYTSRCV